MILPGRMMKVVLQTMLHKPATVMYPAVAVRMCKRFRGKLVFHSEKCIGCKLCMKDCPTDAVNIRKVGDKRFEADIDMGKCIYCAQCVDSCPKKALESTGEFELAQIQRDKLRQTFRGPPPPKPADPPAAAVPSPKPPEETKA